MIVVAQPIDREAFAPFGDLVELAPGGRAANQGTALRRDFCAQLESLRPDAKANLALFRATAQPLPLQLRLLERHPRSSQLFAPLDCSRYAIVVAPSDPRGEPAWSALQAFVCAPGQAINYHTGTWHHPILPLDRDATLLMLTWEDGTAADCEERALPEAIELRVD